MVSFVAMMHLINLCLVKGLQCHAVVMIQVQCDHSSDEVLKLIDEDIRCNACITQN